MFLLKKTWFNNIAIPNIVYIGNFLTR